MPDALVTALASLGGAIVGGSASLVGTLLTHRAQRERDERADAIRLRDERRERLRQLYIRAYTAAVVNRESMARTPFILDEHTHPDVSSALRRETIESKAELERTKCELELAAGAERVLDEFNRVYLATKVLWKIYGDRLTATGRPPAEDDPEWSNAEGIWFEAHSGFMAYARISLLSLDPDPSSKAQLWDACR